MNVEDAGPSKQPRFGGIDDGNVDIEAVNPLQTTVGEWMDLVQLSAILVLVFERCSL